MSIITEARPWLKTGGARKTTIGDVLNMLAAACEDCGWEVMAVEGDGGAMTVDCGHGRSLRIDLDLAGGDGDDDDEIVPYENPAWGEDLVEREVGYGLKVAEGEVWELGPETVILPPELDGDFDDDFDFDDDGDYPWGGD